MIYQMINPMQAYAWGSFSYIQDMLGRRDLCGQAIAELWLGAHPQAPSTVVSRQTGAQQALKALIAADPPSHLGSRHSEHSDRLPFLLKILAARIPLSIQAHPNLLQAREGFERENRQGIPLDAPERNYKDDNHKPELICALTPFKAMCGFMPYERIIANLRASGLGSALDGFAKFEQDPCAETLRALFLGLLAVSKPRCKSLLSALLGALERMEDPQIREFILLLAEHFPSDIGIYAPLFLNLIELQPGQAIYLEAGILHAYLEGAGIEIMANSDNVLRGGLTPKHIDLGELAKVVLFNPYTPELIGSDHDSDGISDYACPAREFHLQRLSLHTSEGYVLESIDSPRILLCVYGNCLCSEGSSPPISLTPGQSIYLPANCNSIQLKGSFTLFIAAVS